MPASDPVLSLLARSQIGDVLVRYARAVDRLDDAAIKTCFHPDATLCAAGERMAAQQFCVVAMGMLRELELTHHQIGNLQIALDGDEAYVETYFTAVHRIGAAGWSPYPQARPGEDLMMRGRYVDRFTLRDGTWAIAHRDMVIDWARFDAADDRGLVANPPEPRGQRDRTDPVYFRRSL